MLLEETEKMRLDILKRFNLNSSSHKGSFPQKLRMEINKEFSL